MLMHYRVSMNHISVRKLQTKLDEKGPGTEDSAATQLVGCS